MLSCAKSGYCLSRWGCWKGNKKFLMDWKKHIENAYRANDSFTTYGSLPGFAEPATLEEIREIERILKCQIPNDLKSLLMQTNGITEKMILNGGYTEINVFIFSSEEIVDINVWHRDHEEDIRPKQRFHKFIVFGQTGVDGIYFALPISNLEDTKAGIYAWYPIDCEFITVAETLEELTFNWPSGKLSV